MIVAVLAVLCVVGGASGPGAEAVTWSAPLHAVTAIASGGDPECATPHGTAPRAFREEHRERTTTPHCTATAPRSHPALRRPDIQRPGHITDTVVRPHCPTHHSERAPPAWPGT
ncbi:hypothetical protein OG758_00965 [Streptomyces sp. NBC_01474]|uniref:hypothetical protein n=1 Tax=unclassified Streptomyces TaxID=2593676 RepID=UPI002DD9EBA4|nr:MULTISPECIES: hypothetical protein [unclassified Streptomyces]WSD92920.1 hypothetical protein OG758_00965 [Streptomyces sp. NBC_01474]